jgi:phosphate transport system permease protein
VNRVRANLEVLRDLGAELVEFSPLRDSCLPAGVGGIMTGILIGVARIAGETAPLLMIGMVAFIADVPDSLTSPATALPVQIFLWADSPERGFVERTSAAIIILLAFMLIMNAAAIRLRKRFERRW